LVKVFILSLHQFLYELLRPVGRYIPVDL